MVLKTTFVRSDQTNTWRLQVKCNKSLVEDRWASLVLVDLLTGGVVISSAGVGGHSSVDGFRAVATGDGQVEQTGTCGQVHMLDVFYL